MRITITTSKWFRNYYFGRHKGGWITVLALGIGRSFSILITRADRVNRLRRR